MSMFRYAWRNLWRNWKRTAITLGAVVSSAVILIIIYALVEGMVMQMVNNATNLNIGEVQVHAPEYREKRSFYNAIENAEAVAAAAEEEGGEAAKRSYGFGLVAQETKSAGARFWGVWPEDEKAAFDMADHILEGGWLAGGADGGIVLGRKLARSLHAEVGDEIVALVQAADGSLGNDLFTVSGILKTMGDEIDRSAALVHHDDFETLFVAGGRIHEVAVNSRNKVEPNEMAAALKKDFPGLAVETWREILPALSDMVHLFDGMMMIFGWIFSLAAAVGVMNTMLMSTFDRMREFGTLKALGTSPWRIMRDVAAEALILSALGAVAGLAIALPLAHLLATAGIDTAAYAGEFSFGGVAFDPVWRASLKLKHIIYALSTICVISLLASLYPAAIAARLDPVRAMRKA